MFVSIYVYIVKSQNTITHRHVSFANAPCVFSRVKSTSFVFLNSLFPHRKHPILYALCCQHIVSLWSRWRWPTEVFFPFFFPFSFIVRDLNYIRTYIYKDDGREHLDSWRLVKGRKKRKVLWRRRTWDVCIYTPYLMKLFVKVTISFYFSFLPYRPFSSI